jgi:hypothetical protein
VRVTRDSIREGGKIRLWGEMREISFLKGEKAKAVPLHATKALGGEEV